MIGNPVNRVHALLSSFRLLEAAGACTVIADTLSSECRPVRPPVWWETLAADARTYRSMIYSAVVQGVSAIDERAQPTPAPADTHDLLQERARLALEYSHWLSDVAGGRAYIAWLSAYVAVAEIDGERAIGSLQICSAIVREFLDVPELDGRGSVYEFLQSAADCLPLFLPLQQHPLSDMRRFAYLPSPLRTGYGS
jgi:hypothetical protein